MRTTLRAAIATMILSVGSTPIAGHTPAEAPAPNPPSAQPIVDDEDNFAVQESGSYCYALEDDGMQEALDEMRKSIRERLIAGAGIGSGQYRSLASRSTTITEPVRGSDDLCEYLMMVNSIICQVTAADTYFTGLDQYLTAKDGGAWRVSFLTERTARMHAYPMPEFAQLPPDDAFFEAVQALRAAPDTPDRTYLAAIARRDGESRISILELPATSGCYAPIFADENRDGIDDLVVTIPDRGSYADGRFRTSRIVACGDDEGGFSARRCRSPRALPPHLRITHPGPYD